jgi:hypothetical protein
MATAGLSLGLIDRNPVATAVGVDLEGGISSETDNSDDDGEEEEDLVVLPAQLETIGALLSTASGGASALCKAAYALLVGYPMWGLLVESTGTPSTLEQFITGNIVLGIAESCMCGGMLLAGPAAVHALRLAARPGGNLVRLGAGAAYVPRSVLLSLESSARKLRRGGTALAGTFLQLWC